MEVAQQVQQTQPVENAALCFALMSVLVFFIDVRLVLISSEKSSTLSSLSSESTSSLSREEANIYRIDSRIQQSLLFLDRAAPPVMKLTSAM